jgi:creatinine amidohydrolase/Fe(II)-dependent formamide hydrolase-like protein
MLALRSHRLEDLTTLEIRDAIRNGVDVAILPVGSTEQHGPHLPMATDSLHTVEILERVAKRLPGLLAPLLPIGRAEHHMAFAGTLSVAQETLHLLIRDCCASLFHHGFRHVLIYSGHGGNAGPLASIVADLTAAHPEWSVIGCTNWAIYDDALFPVAESFGVSKFAAGWHAAELETSMILAMKPELVLMDRAAPDFMGDLHQKRDIVMAEGVQAIAPTGVLGDPTIATAEHGERYLDALTESVARFFQDELQKRPA